MQWSFRPSHWNCQSSWSSRSRTDPEEASPQLQVKLGCSPLTSTVTSSWSSRTSQMGPPHPTSPSSPAIDIVRIIASHPKVARGPRRDTSPIHYQDISRAYRSGSDELGLPPLGHDAVPLGLFVALDPDDVG